MRPIQQVLHQGMHSARMEVDENDGFTPFAMVAHGDKIRLVATAGIEISDLGHGIEVYSQCLKDHPADAIIFCIDMIVGDPESGVRESAIYFILENEDVCICGFQIYSRDDEGQMVFDEIVTEEAAHTFFGREN